MSKKKKLVIVITRGLDDERSSVAWSIAMSGIAMGLEVSIFLVSSGGDWARKGAADNVHLNPADPPVKDMIQNVIESGSKISLCPPCAKMRGYEKEDLIQGVEIVGSTAVHAPILDGAATLTF